MSIVVLPYHSSGQLLVCSYIFIRLFLKISFVRPFKITIKVKSKILNFHTIESCQQISLLALELPHF